MLTTVVFISQVMDLQCGFSSALGTAVISLLHHVVANYLPVCRSQKSLIGHCLNAFCVLCKYLGRRVLLTKHNLFKLCRVHAYIPLSKSFGAISPIRCCNAGCGPTSKDLYCCPCSIARSSKSCQR